MEIFLILYLLISLICTISLPISLIKYRRFKNRFSGVLDAEIEEARVRDQASKVEEKIKNLKSQYAEKYERLKYLEQALVPLEDLEDARDAGFHEIKFQLEDHASYIRAIKNIRADQKTMAKEKLAVLCDGNWTVENSRAEGKKMENRAIRIALRSFNNECDVLISKVSWRNIDSIIDRIWRSVAALDKLNESLKVEISPRYVALKVTEAKLVSEEALKKEEERQLLREEKEGEREEAKAQREIAAEMKKREKLEREKMVALAAIRAQLETASEEHRLALEQEAAEMERDMAAEALEKGRLLSMAEQTRIGHLYVISNKGAFGERLVKIGMTRRLEPMDRVKELGDASVPFPFDVHAMVFSEDAPKLENELHAVFDAKRSNKVNKRKEFFEVSLKDVHAELERRIPNVPFNYSAPSMEYAASVEQVKNELVSNKPSASFSATL